MGYMGKTADWTDDVQRTTTDTLHKKGKHKIPLQNKLVVHRLLYPSIFIESLVKGKSVEENLASYLETKVPESG